MNLRERISEIEDAVATGRATAAQVFTQMRALMKPCGLERCDDLLCSEQGCHNDIAVLMKFYAVESFRELILTQDAHIERLQKQLEAALGGKTDTPQRTSPSRPRQGECSVSARHRKHSRAIRDARWLVEALTSRFVTCPIIADALTIKVELDSAREQLAALEASAPEARAEGQSPAVGNVDHSNETVSSRAESEPAVSVAPPLTPND